jgi:hypothetical protein
VHRLVAVRPLTVSDLEKMKNKPITPVRRVFTKFPTSDVPLPHVEVEFADLPLDKILESKNVLHLSELAVWRERTTDTGHGTGATS